jgi:hypothetical protein
MASSDLAETAMFDSYECQCIYVEARNDSDPRSGRVEYRAQSCAVCQARAALMRADTNAIVAFDQFAPRYQRMH